MDKNRINSAITVNDLYRQLAIARKQGLGDKMIMVSDDDEGNGYHELFDGLFIKMEGLFHGYSATLPYGVSVEDAENNYVILS